MGDVAITRIMTESRDVISIVKTLNCRQNEKRRVKFRLELYMSITFTKESQNKRIHCSSRSQVKVPWEHACVLLHAHDQHVIRDLQESNMF